MATRRTAKSKPKPGSLLENVKTVVYAALIALTVRSFFAEPFNIPSGSMIPTLQVGDYLFVSKFSYGYSRYSLPFGPAIFSGRLFGRLPRRGDIAVFRKPTEPSVDFIKRIVGLPGDHIKVNSGILYINGQPAVRQPAGDYTATGDGPPTVYQRYIETLPNGPAHSILKATDLGPMNNTSDYVIPAGHVFGMGDNRDNSEDSRFLDQVGYIPVENLVGPAEFIFFSIDAEHPWWEIWYWPFEIRWSRLFTAVR